MKQDLDINSREFCILPWVHLNVWTDGRVLPCCINHETSFGNVKDRSIDEIFNGPEAKAFRKSIMDGKLPATCHRCTDPEKKLGAFSNRMGRNRRFAHLMDFVKTTEADGRLPEFKFAYLDIRVSNLCNFACRMCDAINSSSVARDEKKLGRWPEEIPTVQKPFKNFSDLLKFLDRNIAGVEEFYFCGGEPLILEEHYQILELFILHGKTDVQLHYNTNLSKLSLGEKSILKYWKKFKNVFVGASLDAPGARGEYIRKGTDWDMIVKNRQKILAETPHVKFAIEPTVQILNAFAIPQFHLDWIESGLVQPYDITFNLLTYPPFFSLQTMTPDLKARFREEWERYIAKLAEMPNTEHVRESASKMVGYAFLEEARPDTQQAFRDEIKKLDELRGESFPEVFPELEEMGVYS